MNRRGARLRARTVKPVRTPGIKNAGQNFFCSAFFMPPGDAGRAALHALLSFILFCGLFFRSDAFQQSLHPVHLAFDGLHQTELSPAPVEVLARIF